MVQNEKIDGVEDDDCLKLVLNPNEMVQVNSAAQIVLQNLNIIEGNNEENNNTLFGFQQSSQNLLKFISNIEKNLDNFLHISSIFNGKIKQFKINTTKQLIIATNTFLACTSNIEITEYTDFGKDINCLLLKKNDDDTMEEEGYVWINTFGKIYNIGNIGDDANIKCNKKLFVGIEKNGDNNDNEITFESDMMVIPPSNEKKTIWLQTNNEYDFIKKLNNNQIPIINKYVALGAAAIANIETGEETGKEPGEETGEEAEKEAEEQAEKEPKEQEEEPKEPGKEPKEQENREEENREENREENIEKTGEENREGTGEEEKTPVENNEVMKNAVVPKGGKTKKRVRSIKKNKKIKQKSLRRK